MLVVTKYLNNGESWEDNWEDEKPIAIFSNIDDLISYCKEKGFTEPKIVDERKREYVKYKYVFKSIEMTKRIVPWVDDYDDMSWMEFHVYEIEGSKELDKFGGALIDKDKQQPKSFGKEKEIENNRKN